MAPKLQYCPTCGGSISYQIPEGDNRERAVCTQCGTIHYQNPRMVVGTIPIWQNQVLLCKRAIEPRRGFWTLPAGFLEIGESTDAGAVRETMEEAGAAVSLKGPFSIIDVPHVEQVHLFFRAELDKPEFSAGLESLEVRLFSEHEIPWEELAFATVYTTLRWFFEDRAAERFLVHTKTLQYRPKAVDS